MHTSTGSRTSNPLRTQADPDRPEALPRVAGQLETGVHEQAADVMPAAAAEGRPRQPPQGGPRVGAPLAAHTLWCNVL